MAKYTIDETTLKAIADAIRTKTGMTGTMTAAEMPDLILGIDNRDVVGVNFYNWDGSELLLSTTVLDGDDAVYEGSNPTRASTAQYSYTFVGWALTPDGEADENALKTVTSERNLYAAYSSTVRTYNVYFYNGSTLLQTVSDVPYGGSATYTGETPVDPDGDGRDFIGWSPLPSDITGTTSCYAQYQKLREVVEITDDWATIFAAIDDGTYKEKYKVGNYKPIDLGSEGIVNMQIAGFDKDEKADGSGLAPISWISQELLATDHRMNPALVTNYEYPEQASWTASSNTWTSQNRYVVSDAIATWTITANEAGTLTISYKTSNANTSRNTLTLTVNGEAVATDVASTTAATHDVTVNAGDVVTVYVKYSLLNASYNYYGTVTFSSTGAFTVDAAVENAPTRKMVDYQDATGAIGGWEKSEMRTYMQETIKPLIPEEIRNRILTVTKTQTAYNTSGSSFSQTTQDDVWLPSYPECFGTSSLYKALFENTNANRIKYKAGSASASYWWLRSPTPTTISTLCAPAAVPPTTAVRTTPTGWRSASVHNLRPLIRPPLWGRMSGEDDQKTFRREAADYFLKFSPCLGSRADGKVL